MNVFCFFCCHKVQRLFAPFISSLLNSGKHSDGALNFARSHFGCEGFAFGERWGSETIRLFWRKRPPSPDPEVAISFEFSWTFLWKSQWIRTCQIAFHFLMQLTKFKVFLRCFPQLRQTGLTLRPGGAKTNAWIPLPSPDCVFMLYGISGHFLPP